MKAKGLDKVLRLHASYCKMHEYSLQGKRYCSCGRDLALQELSLYQEAEALLRKINAYLDTHESIASVSFAKKDIEDLLEKMK